MHLTHTYAFTDISTYTHTTHIKHAVIHPFKHNTQKYTRTHTHTQHYQTCFFSVTKVFKRPSLMLSVHSLSLISVVPLPLSALALPSLCSLFPICFSLPFLSAFSPPSLSLSDRWWWCGNRVVCCVCVCVSVCMCVCGGVCVCV